LSWQNIDLSKVSTQPEVIPDGVYTLELNPGSKLNDKESVLVSASISQDGEFTGRKVYFSYPDPESVSSKGTVNSWSAVAFKRLEQAIGVDMNEGELPVDYLNRVAGNKFQAPIQTTPATDEYPQPRTNVKIFNVRPAV
jgi:hypothetical protein